MTNIIHSNEKIGTPTRLKERICKFTILLDHIFICVEEVQIRTFLEARDHRGHGFGGKIAFQGKKTYELSQAFLSMRSDMRSFSEISSG